MKRAPSIAAPALFPRTATTTSPPLHTPSAISTCSAATLTPACLSLLSPLLPATTVTVKQTSCQCTTVLTTSLTTNPEPTRIITVTVTSPATPPPDIIAAPASVTLTTTVPAACAGPPHNPQGYVDTAINALDFPQYPLQPGTAVECCVACWLTTGCVANAWIASGGDCEFLMRVNGSSGVRVSQACPRGVEEYPFGPVARDGDVRPGPCGR